MEKLVPEAGAGGDYTWVIYENFHLRTSESLCQRAALRRQDAWQTRTYYYIRYSCSMAISACQSFSRGEEMQLCVRYKGLFTCRCQHRVNHAVSMRTYSHRFIGTSSLRLTIPAFPLRDRSTRAHSRKE